LTRSTADASFRIIPDSAAYFRKTFSLAHSTLFVLLNAVCRVWTWMVGRYPFHVQLFPSNRSNSFVLSNFVRKLPHLIQVCPDFPRRWIVARSLHASFAIAESEMQLEKRCCATPSKRRGQDDTSKEPEPGERHFSEAVAGLQKLAKRACIQT
jgi:hypothetical protein